MKESGSSVALPSRNTLIAIIVGFFVLTFLVYGASLNNRFVAWDDNYIVNFNPVVRGFTLENVSKAFTSFVDPELYNPLTFLSYQFDYTIGGLKPFMFHFDNLILHTLNALLVGWFVLLLSKRGWIGLMCGILFAIHPLNTEAVAWVSARKDTLSTLFFFLSLIGYLYFSQSRERRKLYYVASLLAFLCALLSKAMTVTLPVVLLLIDYLERRKWSPSVIIEKLPFFGLSLLFGAVALFGKQDVVAESTLTQKVLMAGKSTVFYLKQLFFPTHLSVLYPYSKPIVLSSPEFFLPILLISGLLLVVWLVRNRLREATFGILFFLVTLVPTFFNYSKGREAYFASDRYAYIPQVGILLVVLTVAYLFEKRRTVLGGTLCIVALIFSVFSYKQSLTWRDTETLFVQTLRYYPDAVAARINLGLVYRESGLLVKAMDQFTKAVAQEPNNALVHTNIGATYEKQGKLQEAKQEYEKAIALEPKQPDAYFALGMMRERAGNLDEAFVLYEKVRDMNPGYIGVYNNLGSVYVQRGDYVSAEAMYRKATEIDPFYSDAHFNLAYVLEKLNRPDEAEQEYETTLDLEGEKLDILRTLVGLYATQNKTTDTVRTLRRMLVLDPHNEFALTFMESLREHGLVK